MEENWTKKICLENLTPLWCFVDVMKTTGTNNEVFYIYVGPQLDSIYIFVSSFTVCYKTEVIKNTLNPNWKEIEVPVRTICNGDYDRTIKVEVYDWDRDGG